MNIEVDENTLSLFKRSKDICQRSNSSDSEFLRVILLHFDKCVLSLVGKSRDSNVNSTLKTCPECTFSTSSQSDLWDHFQSSHFGDGTFSCTCGDLYHKLPEFLRHYVDCPVAATDLQDPIADNPKKDDRSHLNNFCLHNTSHSNTESGPSNGTAKPPSQLYQRYHHPPVTPVPGPSEKQPYGCPKCSKAFKNKSLLDQHMHLHFPPRYVCRWCGKLYRWPPVYYHHKQKCKKRPGAFGVNPITGNEYDLNTLTPLTSKGGDFTTSNNPNINQMSMLPNLNHVGPWPGAYPNHIGSSTSNLLNGSLPQANLAYLCATEGFPNFPTFSGDLENCPSIPPLSSSNLALIQSCPSNSSAFDPTGFMSPSQAFRSPAGTKRESYDLTDKPSFHFGRGRIFTCGTCSKIFTSKLSLKQHVDGKHRPEGKYICPTCGKRYRWGASFYYHKKSCVQAHVSDTNPENTANRSDTSVGGTSTPSSSSVATAAPANSVAVNSVTSVANNVVVNDGDVSSNSLLLPPPPQQPHSATPLPPGIPPPPQQQANILLASHPPDPVKLNGQQQPPLNSAGSISSLTQPQLDGMNLLTQPM